MNLLHDAELTGISIDRLNSFVIINFRMEDGTESKLELSGLRVIRCEDLTMQNVVSRILQSVEGHFTEKELEHWVLWVTSYSDSKSWLKEGKVSEWLDEIASGKLNLVLIEPSVGATVVALCRQILIHP